MISEIWVPISGCEGFYEISNLGQVRSVKRGKILKPLDNTLGYKYVHLKYGCGGKKYIHRLVAFHFVPNPKPDINTVVNHLDFNPKNNNASNLEWTTTKGNMHYSIRAGRFDRTDEWIKNLRMSKEKDRRPVVGKSKQTGEEIFFECLNDSEKRGFQPSCVCNCCKGKRESHKGFTWRYANDQRTMHNATFCSV